MLYVNTATDAAPAYTPQAAPTSHTITYSGETKERITRNSSFAVDTYFRESENDIHFVNVNGAFLWLGGDLYTEKDNVANIYRDGSKNILRVKHTPIRQKNEYFNLESRIEEEGTYSFSLY